MTEHVFVAREQELARLNESLNAAFRGQGGVCLIIGEAGSGKTALVTEFARRAEIIHRDLITAVGDCNAQTGISDPYLPFRELLNLLTGDVASKQARGAITQDSANRLQDLLRISGGLLVEFGPDLIDIFVPGAGLAARAAKVVADKVGWLEALQKLAERKTTGTGAAGLEQSHIFQQYAKVLQGLAAQRPLMLVVDDLHWADASSIGLLFHLGRRIGGSRVLLVGTFRPEEVALGRDGERHPLERVVSEFKRYYGDICVDLNQADEDEGQRFVDALLDSEPNRLSYPFRQALLQHTRGHPLFTVELLRDLQERGQLVRDREGRWVETPTLNWGKLPPRVEGVIDERISRLEEGLREIASVASVEGEDFTAQVVSSVRQAELRTLIRQLSRELDRKHRLVGERGSQEVGRQRLHLYRFRHSLFQRHLYSDLGDSERELLHGDVGTALETLYGEHSEEIVPQLAYHFSEAREQEKATTYLRRAGEQAAMRYANAEAVNFFSQALALAPEQDAAQRYALLLGREKGYNALGARELQGRDLSALEALAEQLDDDRRRAEIALRRARYADMTGDYPAVLSAAQDAIGSAQAAQEVALEADGFGWWGRALWRVGDFQAARAKLDQALELAASGSLRPVEADTLRNLGNINAQQGDLGPAREHYLRALSIFRDIDDRLGEAGILNNLGNVAHYGGDYFTSQDYFEQALSLYRRTGNRQGEGMALGNLSGMLAELGQFARSRGLLEQALRLSREIGDRHGEGNLCGNLAAVCNSQGDYGAARAYAERSLVIFQEVGARLNTAVAHNRVGILCQTQGDYSEARKCLDEGLRISREVGDQRTIGWTLSNLGELSRRLGDYATGMSYYEQGVTTAREMGDRRLLTAQLADFSLLCHDLGDDQAARGHGQEALRIALEIGDEDKEAQALTSLGHALAGVGNMREARASYEKALTLRHKLKQPHRAAEVLTGLARLALAEGDTAQASARVEEIVDDLGDNDLEGTVDRIAVFLTCYRALQDGHDPRSREVLATAYELLQYQACKISDSAVRSSFLNNVTANREVMDEAARVLGDRGDSSMG